MPVLNHWLKKEQRFILLFTLSSRWLKASSDPLWASNRTARSVRTEHLHCMQWIAASFTSFSPRNDMCVRVVTVPYSTIPFTPCHREGVARGDPLWADNRRDNSSASSRHDGLPCRSLTFPPRNDKKCTYKKRLFLLNIRTFIRTNPSLDKSFAPISSTRINIKLGGFAIQANS